LGICFAHPNFTFSFWAELQMFVVFLAINPATSAASERVFSKGRQIISMAEVFFEAKNCLTAFVPQGMVSEQGSRLPQLIVFVFDHLFALL
jgi:hypothetical protein